MKLYTITRKDLPTLGYCYPQGMHSAIQFQYEHSKVAKKWYKKSNTVVNLSVDTIRQLNSLIKKLTKLNIPISVFKEPDIGNKITSVSFIGNEDSKKLVKNLPLTFKGIYETNNCN